MGRGKPVEIAGLSFPTHAAFKDHVKKMLEDIPLGDVIREPEHSFLIQFVHRHKTAAEKIGAGIDHFKALTNTNYGGRTKCFYLFRKDGTQTDFSYQKCLPTPTLWEEFVDALSGSVMDLMIQSREQAFGNKNEILCPVKNIPMVRSVSYIDHAAPYTFDVLVEKFVDEEWLHEENPPAVEGANSLTGRRLADKEMEKRWRYFYSTHATLLVISKEAHIERNAMSKNVGVE